MDDEKGMWILLESILNLDECEVLGLEYLHALKSVTCCY